ncbi:MAG TPA: FAD-binding oxidoreductase [Blastocatellia bacterium]|nr:FAD-binding oxidoreductase [Blastocatellia bacterium]
MSEMRRSFDPNIDQEKLQNFKSRLRGRLIQPGDEGYDAARTIWNAMIDKHPALIVRCAGVSDVIESVNFARDNDVQVSIRGGGHNVAGNALAEGGLVIDMSGMKSIRVDPASRTARAEPGLTWAEFDHETQAFGLATTGGVVGTTGVAGLTLGGGVGWLHAVYGLTADNLLSADVVLADGSFVRASSDENEDLFWALRGGGGNFGVVTSFEYRLHPLQQMLAGPVFHPAERAFDVLRFYRDFIATLPDELTAYTGFLTDPEGNRLIGIVVCYVGDIEEGERLVRPVREFGPPVADMIGPMPYRALQGMFDAAFPPGWLNYWKGGFVEELSDEALRTIAEHSIAPPSPTSLVMLENYHGAYSRVGPGETAYSHRDAHYDLLILASWADPAETEKNVQWARSFFEAMQPHFGGKAFPNLMGQDEMADRARDAYGKSYDRLAQIKKKYDPTNFFRLNLNVKPS